MKPIRKQPSSRPATWLSVPEVIDMICHPDRSAAEWRDLLFVYVAIRLRVSSMSITTAAPQRTTSWRSTTGSSHRNTTLAATFSPPSRHRFTMFYQSIFHVPRLPIAKDHGRQAHKSQEQPETHHNSPQTPNICFIHSQMVHRKRLVWAVVMSVLVCR